ncbi:hypothetical protein JTE90_028569 [Oedothorax gibbosus]|uniref:Uncharacterized protein n=1 Tax=Oedothorax gibbosus TaxID=931172 RepID=A0AAV6VV50_9ARAC|nr:hypothetical protein JTE90_028569 [Oedothorax gibbosus]
MFRNLLDEKLDEKNHSRGLNGVFILEDDEKELQFDENDKELSFTINVQDSFRMNPDTDTGYTKRKFKNQMALNKQLNISTHNKVEESSFTSLTKAFLKKSSIYALNQIGNSNTTRRKIFWAFILIGGIIGCCSQVIRYLSAYYAYPVVINIDSVNIFDQDFPGVTICNLNNVKSSFFPCVLRKEDYEKCNRTNLQMPSSLEEAVKWVQPDCFKLAVPKLSDEFQERMRFTSLYFSLTEDSRKRFGHQAEDFIKSCSFNGEDCFHTDFSVYSDGTYGNCFTFNTANTSKEPLKTSYIGPNSGLTLELDVESSEYIWLTQSVGARVIVHDPYKEPIAQDIGINVSPGFETTLGLSMTSMIRLESPYIDHCKKYGRGDSKRQCDISCNEKKIFSRCGCLPPSKTQLDSHVNTCDLSNVMKLCCQHLVGYKSESVEFNVTCDCPLECVSSDFEIKISSGMWPTQVRHLASKEYANLSVEDVSSTVLKLKLYFDTLERLTYEQKPMFEDSEVLSQIGGQMGLWLGLSLAAVFECLENMVLFWQYRKKKANELSE